MTAICIYHNNCADGFGAAWAVRKHFKERNEPCEFFPGTYGKAPPDVIGREVWIVDFSYKRDVMERICDAAFEVIHIDHHKTALDDLKDFNGPNLTKVYDLDRSGAGLTWDYIFDKVPRPALIDHIEDRDLWRFKLPGTRQIQAALFSFPYDFEVWDSFAYTADRLYDDGVAIERKHFKDIKELLAAGQRMGMVGGYTVPICNLPYIYSSDAGHIMSNEHPFFAACYWETKDGTVFSLRSSGKEYSIDVSEVAKLYGGGGHASAAGFTIKPGELKHFMSSLQI